MKMEITVAEVVNLINEIRNEPESLFEMIITNVMVDARQSGDKHLLKLSGYESMNILSLQNL